MEQDRVNVRVALLLRDRDDAFGVALRLRLDVREHLARLLGLDGSDDPAFDVQHIVNLAARNRELACRHARVGEPFQLFNAVDRLAGSAELTVDVVPRSLLGILVLVGHGRLRVIARGIGQTVTVGDDVSRCGRNLARAELALPRLAHRCALRDSVTEVRQSAAASAP
jgi:hypothetical protein